MGVVFLSYPDRDPRRGWYVHDAGGVAAGPFDPRMDIDLFTTIEAIQLGTGASPAIRRALPGDVVEELRDAARAGLAAVVPSEERLDAFDGDATAPSRTAATWGRLAR